MVFTQPNLNLLNAYVSFGSISKLNSQTLDITLKTSGDTAPWMLQPCEPSLAYSRQYWVPSCRPRSWYFPIGRSQGEWCQLSLAATLLNPLDQFINLATYSLRTRLLCARAPSCWKLSVDEEVRTKQVFFQYATPNIAMETIYAGGFQCNRIPAYLSHIVFNSLEIGSSHSVLLCHSFCIRILAWIVTGPIKPNGSKIFDIADNTWRLVIILVASMGSMK